MHGSVTRMGQPGKRRGVKSPPPFSDPHPHPPPPPPKFTKFGLLVTVPKKNRENGLKTLNKSKSALPEKNTQIMDLINLGGGGSDVGPRLEAKSVIPKSTLMCSFLLLACIWQRAPILWL